MLGKLLLTLDAIALLFGAPAADLSETHIYNHRWPPHAKFHCGQTITLSVTLGVATLYYTWRSAFLPSSTPALVAARVRQDSINSAVFVGTIYWLAAFAALLYPGTDGIDPEFGPPGFPQGPVFATFVGLSVVGWALESWRHGSHTAKVE